MQRIALLAAAAAALSSLVGCCCSHGCGGGGGGYGACYQPAPSPCGSPCGPCGASYSPAPTYLGAPSGGCPSGNCGVYPSGAYVTPAGAPAMAMAPGGPMPMTAMMPTAMPGAYQTASVAMDPMPTY